MNPLTRVLRLRPSLRLSFRDERAYLQLALKLDKEPVTY